jgi:hypothetical protein
LNKADVNVESKPIKLEVSEVSRNGLITIKFNQAIKVPENFQTRSLSESIDMNEVIKIGIV